MTEPSSERRSNGHPRILIKYGGNAMTDESLSRKVVGALCDLVRAGYRIVLVHGGGPFIEEALRVHGIDSEFVAGHRRTTEVALPVVEMALKGKVNGMLVGMINRAGLRAVGISGKDGKMIGATRRFHIDEESGTGEPVDIGLVGDVASVDTSLVESLLAGDYVPVITCIACDDEGNDYNINADMMAGHLAGALAVDDYVVLTDVDGLMTDPKDPGTLIREASVESLSTTYRPYIKGGMIPKIEACIVAVNRGARRARILNGTTPQAINDLFIDKKPVGTSITT